MTPMRRPAGFVLVLVLAMLVVLGLLAGGIAAVTARLVAQAQERAQGMQDAVDIASTRATVIYLLTTQRMTLGGVTVDNLVSMGDAGVRPMPVVVVLPVRQRLSSVGRVLVGHAVGPFPQSRLDEALGLAVGLRPVGPGELLCDAQLGARSAEGF